MRQEDTHDVASHEQRAVRTCCHVLLVSGKRFEARARSANTAEILLNQHDLGGICRGCSAYRSALPSERGHIIHLVNYVGNFLMKGKQLGVFRSHGEMGTTAETEHFRAVDVQSYVWPVF